MADAVYSPQLADMSRPEDILNETHAETLLEQRTAVSERCDSCTLLPAMLNPPKTVVSKFSSIRMSEDTEHTAVVFGIVRHSLKESIVVAPTIAGEQRNTTSQLYTNCAKENADPQMHTRGVGVSVEDQ